MPCGWALLSVGAPCVAQRVWPMPVVPGSGARSSDGGEVAELALGAAALDVAVHQRGDAGAVIAAIFQPAQRIQDAAARPAATPMTPTMPHI